jgi:hypothetical protein
MKTVKEHLKKLPLQKRLQAMENIRRGSSSSSLMEIMKLKTEGKELLSFLFIFNKTQQCHRYWYNINYKYYPYGN